MGWTKGSSFQLFKKYRAQLYEGSEFTIICPPQTHSEWISAAEGERGKILCQHCTSWCLFSQSGYAKLKSDICLKTKPADTDQAACSAFHYHAEGTNFPGALAQFNWVTTTGIQTRMHDTTTRC